VFMGWVNLISLGHELNTLFCSADPCLGVTARSFRMSMHGEGRAKPMTTCSVAFSSYLEMLETNELVTLTHFITGKRRLPCLDIGEDMIRVAWDPTVTNPAALAKGQNCTNTLILPYYADSVERIALAIDPVYRFGTVFGFM
jgi:hypothetical protein